MVVLAASTPVDAEAVGADLDVIIEDDTARALGSMYEGKCTPHIV